MEAAATHSSQSRGKNRRGLKGRREPQRRLIQTRYLYIFPLQSTQHVCTNYGKHCTLFQSIRGWATENSKLSTELMRQRENPIWRGRSKIYVHRCTAGGRGAAITTDCLMMLSQLTTPSLKSYREQLTITALLKEIPSLLRLAMIRMELSSEKCMQDRMKRA